MANDVQLFKGAGLPAGDLAKYKQALARAQATAPIIGGTPILKLGKDGTWRYGQHDTEVQEGSEWAVNPVTMQKGYIAWATQGGTKPLGKVVRPILQGNLPLESDLPDVGAPWSENVSFQLQCMNGEDKGTMVEYASNSMGGIEAFHVLVAHLMHQIEVDPSKLVPVVSLANTSYQHANRSYGLKGVIFKPVFEIVEWVSGGMETAAAEPEAKREPEPATPPRRGRPPANMPAEATPARAATPSRRAAVNGAGKPAYDPVADAAASTQEQYAAAGQPEDAGPVVRRRRRVVTDIPA